MSDEHKEPELQSWIDPELEARVVAMVLGEASAFEAAELERIIEEKPELGIFKRRIEAVHGLVRAASRIEMDPMRMDEGRRRKLLERLGGKEAGAKTVVMAMPLEQPTQGWRFSWKTGVEIAVCLLVVAFLASIAVPAYTGVQSKAIATRMLSEERQASMARNTASENAPEDQVLLPPQRLAALDSLKALANNSKDVDENGGAVSTAPEDRAKVFSFGGGTVTEGITQGSVVQHALADAQKATSEDDAQQFRAVEPPAQEPAPAAAPQAPAQMYASLQNGAGANAEIARAEPVQQATQQAQNASEDLPQAAASLQQDRAEQQMAQALPKAPPEYDYNPTASQSFAQKRQLQISGANTYTGAVTITAGSTTINNGGTLTVGSNAGKEVVLSGNPTLLGGGTIAMPAKDEPDASQAAQPAQQAAAGEETSQSQAQAAQPARQEATAMLAAPPSAVAASGQAEPSLAMAQAGQAQPAQAEAAAAAEPMPQQAQQQQLAEAQGDMAGATAPEAAPPVNQTRQLQKAEYRLSQTDVNGVSVPAEPAAAPAISDEKKAATDRNTASYGMSSQGTEKFAMNVPMGNTNVPESVAVTAPAMQNATMAAPASTKFGVHASMMGDVRVLNGDTPVLGRLLTNKAKEPAAPVPQDEVSATDQPYSTFSLHVSDVSFLLARAALAQGEMPDRESIRPEEFYNAFDYGDPAPATGEKIACRIEQAAHPMLQQRNLVRIAMKVAATGRGAGQPLRLTVLLDTSGSMEREDRAASVRKAMGVLASLLGPNDSVTLIGFARQPRLLAEAVPGDQAGKLVDIVKHTPSEGGTNMEEAIKTASALALRHFEADAQNRVVMLTDGAANLGDADPAQLSKLVERLRQKGVSFDACGVGADGLNDDILEALTRKGGGRYYFLNQPEDADEGFARQLAGAFRPAAEDVKMQVRFNPSRVGKYRLIGFEKHRLKQEDFRNDKVTAAQLAAEEAAVALYQVQVLPEGDGEIGEVFVRFRDPASGAMTEKSWTIPYDAQAPALEKATPSMQLAATAALVAEKLRGEPEADAIDLGTLEPVVARLRGYYAQQPRVGDLVTMFEQTRRMTEGK